MVACDRARGKRSDSFEFKRHTTAQVTLQRKMSQDKLKPANPFVVRYDKAAQMKEKGIKEAPGMSVKLDEMMQKKFNAEMFAKQIKNE